MKVSRAHKIRLDPNNAQADYFAQACGCARVAFNWGLAEWKRQYAAGEKPSAFGLKHRFNALKREQFPYMLDVTKCAPERAFVNLGKAFNGFFRNIKAGRKPGYPRFKRRGLRDSFYVANDQFTLNGKRIRIPKLGWVRMRERFRFNGDKIMSATISRTAGHWSVSIQVERDLGDVPQATGLALGIDVGIKNIAVTSDGRVFANRRSTRRFAGRLRLAQKRVSRRQKGSKNRRKAVAKLATVHERIANVRRDTLHKSSTDAITKAGLISMIVLEDLNVAGMLKNHRIAKALSDASVSELHRQIVYKAAQRGIRVLRADRFFPSSKMCSDCGALKAELGLGERDYVCQGCGLSIDRDLNAAINLRNLAGGFPVSACRLGGAGPDSSGTKPPIGQELFVAPTPCWI